MDVLMIFKGFLRHPDDNIGDYPLYLWDLKKHDFLCVSVVQTTHYWDLYKYQYRKNNSNKYNLH